MNKIEMSFDNMPFKSKPTGFEVSQISIRIAKNKKTLNNGGDIKKFAELVGQMGHTFCPATFNNGIRNTDGFEQLQLLTLDFDKGISLDEVFTRAKEYILLPLFVYETFSSVNQDKFRVVFLNDLPITDERLAKISLDALLTIFPEADQNCKDITRMFYGGKKLLYFDYSLPTVNTESLLRNMTICLNRRRGDNHYKQHIARFAKNHSIRLNDSGLLDISIINILPEDLGTLSNGKKSPSAIIIPVLPIIDNGEFFPKSHYCISLVDNCTLYSGREKPAKNHAEYRASALRDISKKCRLYREFESGDRKLPHDELFGISTNIIHVENGVRAFKETLSKYHWHYDRAGQPLWERQLKYISKNSYLPKYCDLYCPYKDECSHGNNILSTAKPKGNSMERLPNYKEEFYPIETAQEDVRQKLQQAIEAGDKKWHIIKAQTGIGKTEAYLELMKITGLKFLIVVPTNKLKRDVFRRAKEMKIQSIISPSLKEIENEIPKDVREHINRLYETGRSKKVYPYICKVIQKREIECLQKFLDEQNEFNEFDGNSITTHRKLLNMDEEAIGKYDVVIIDEDIILNSILPNQCMIPISDLNKMLDYASKDGAYIKLEAKIGEVLDAIKTKSSFTVQGFEWNGNIIKKDEGEDFDDMEYLIDIVSFCLAERFVYMESSKNRNIKEDCIMFIKPYKLNNTKHIMVSATVDEDICGYFFGRQNIEYYECKNARYEGALNQYYEKSFSRSYIDSNLKVLDRIQKWSGFWDMITFKKYNKGDIYFGNAIGCDNMNGKNIDVVGTPYQPPFLYKLDFTPLGTHH